MMEWTVQIDVWEGSREYSNLTTGSPSLPAPHAERLQSMQVHHLQSQEALIIRQLTVSV